MIEINLLPWRDLQRERERTVFMKVLLCSFIGLLSFIFVLEYCTNSLLHSQLRDNQSLEQEVAELNAQMLEINKIKEKCSLLIRQINFITELESDSLLNLHLFDELPGLLPVGVYLSLLEKVDNKIVLSAFAPSNQEITQLIKAIKNNIWMSEPKLMEIKKNSSFQHNQFKVNFKLKAKVAEGQS